MLFSWKGGPLHPGEGRLLFGMTATSSCFTQSSTLVAATQSVSHLSLFSLVRMAPCSWLRSPHRVAVEPRSSSEGEGDASPLHTRLALKPALGVSTIPSTASLRLSLQSLATVFDRSAEPSVRSSHDPSVRSHRSQPDAASPSPRPSPSPRLELGYFRSRETTRALDKAGGSVTPLVGSPSRSRSRSPSRYRPRPRNYLASAGACKHLRRIGPMKRHRVHYRTALKLARPHVLVFFVVCVLSLVCHGLSALLVL